MMVFFKHAFLISLLALCFLQMQTVVADELPQTEVDALNLITRKMGASGWNFNADACDDNIIAVRPTDANRTISCSEFPSNTYHIVSLVIKRFSLPGELPPELTRLPYLEKIDFAYNYFNGSIPQEWASMQLNSISLLVNRLSGSIPSYLGNFTSLIYLSLEANQFSGPVPEELRKLVNLNSLILSSNNLSGNLPKELAELKNLTDFRINDNNFNGSIPDFIGSWRLLDRLEMLASGFKGPIPSSISLLNLTELRISDINGTFQDFPNLRNMRGLKRLVLRNCNISGEIPSYIWEMNNLEILDLSFNQLSGKLPSTISIANMSFLLLTHNMLNGDIPIFTKLADVDLSYNNFRRQDPAGRACQQQNRGRLNLFRSSSMRNDLLGACMEDFTCDEHWYYVYVNCGGNDTMVNGKLYEGDGENSGGAATFYQGGDNWGFSSTGDFLGDSDDTNLDSQIVSSSSSKLDVLYKTARLSPLSLTYYRYCMVNGIYNVTLHFAEIQFTEEKQYNKLGQRIFDIYIQDNLVEKDFNIKTNASGVLIPINNAYSANVSNGILEIRFYWAGKGTTRIPQIGRYGPLLSAISAVNLNYRPQGGKTNIAAIIIGVIGSCLILLALGVLWWRRHSKAKHKRKKDLEGLDIQLASFTLKQIKASTNNFDSSNKIGEGGFGPVYKGFLADGTAIAVKQLSSKSRQGNREFLNEIGMISCLQHPNLVKIHGCCIEGDQLLLVYEYMENNSLASALFGPEQKQFKLNWQTRQKICVGIARGLAFLHEESRFRIVHRDIKGTNVLLDKDLNPKISDFGLAKLDEEEKTHISTRIAGTIGYMAPEYALWGYLTYKADVYSFGIVALEIVSGKKNTNSGPALKFSCLLEWACHLQQYGDLMEIVDEKLGSEFNKLEAERIITVALLCTNAKPSLRPTMSEVVSTLEGTRSIPEVIPEASSYSEDLRFTAIREHREEIRSQTSGTSRDYILTSSVKSGHDSPSSTEHDLYEINSEMYASVKAMG